MKNRKRLLVIVGGISILLVIGLYSVMRNTVQFGLADQYSYMRNVVTQKIIHDYSGSVWVSENPDLKIEVITDGSDNETYAYIDIKYKNEKRRCYVGCLNSNLRNYEVLSYDPVEDANELVVDINKVKLSDRKMIWSDISDETENTDYGKYDEIVFIRQK